MTATVVVQQHDPPIELDLSHREMLDLRAAAGRALTISPTERPDRWAVRSGVLVGTVVTPRVSVLIRPKVNDANLFHLLGPSADALAAQEAGFLYARRPDLAAAFSVFYLWQLERAMARGLERQYVEQHEALAGIRGRVELQGLVRRGGLALPVDCRFDELTADTQLNRLLASATSRTSRWAGVTPLVRQGLRRALAAFSGVGALRPTDLEQPTALTRLNRHFGTVERLARLVLEGSTLNDAPGASEASGFLVDMNRVFERFVEDRLRRYLWGRAEVCGQVPARLDEDGRIRMRPDLVFRESGRPVYVADTKYKLTATGDGREADYYQLLAYCTALGLPEGMLIYCQHDGDAPQRVATVVGPEGRRLVTAAIHLNGKPAEVDARLRKLADTIAQRIGSEAADYELLGGEVSSHSASSV